jgi:opacity protein-like surface antigen
MRYCLFLLLFSLVTPIWGQRVEYGVKLGWQVNRPVPSVLNDDSNRMIWGGFVGVKLWGPLSVEFNPMTRRAGYKVERELGLSEFRMRIWDFPVLARMEGPERAGVKPFVSGGYVRRMVRWSGRVPEGMMASPVSEWLNGGAVGGGVSFKVGRVRIEPEYRYTHIRNWIVSQPAHDVMVGFRF